MHGPAAARAEFARRSMFGLTQSMQLPNHLLANFQGGVLGCIEAEFAIKYSLENS